MMKNKLLIALGLYGEVWALEASALSGLVAQLQLIPAEAMYLSESGRPSEAGYIVNGGVAEIRLTGPMAKDTTSLEAMFGVCSTVALRRQVRHAQANSAVDEIVLIFDSPGGQISGTPELALEVQRCTKKTTAYVDGLCCSAAYWVASQCDEIICSPFAKVGSIGCYTVMVDSSEQAANEGLKFVLVSSGGIKGHPSVGVTIPDEAIAARQSEVGEVMAMFTEFIAHGRAMSAESVSELADGRVWGADEALGLGLIDSIALWDERSSGTENMNIRDLFKPKAEAKVASAEELAAAVAPLQMLSGIAPVSIEPTAEQKAFIDRFIGMQADAYLSPLAVSGKVLNTEIAKAALVEAYKADNATLVDGNIVDGTLVASVKALIESQPDRSVMFQETVPKLPVGSVALTDKPANQDDARVAKYRQDNNLPEKK